MMTMMMKIFKVFFIIINFKINLKKIYNFFLASDEDSIDCDASSNDDDSLNENVSDDFVDDDKDTGDRQEKIIVLTDEVYFIFLY